MQGIGATLSFFLISLTKKFEEAQKQDSNIAKQSYTMAFSKYLDKQSVLLDAEGEKLTSIEFSNMIKSYSTQSGIIKFFIAGAFGFEKEILKQHKTISLSTLTFSHEIAKIVLLEEQIYRSLSIINKHPYHKL